MIPESQAFGKNFTKQAYWLHYQIHSKAQQNSGLLITADNIAFWIKEYSVISIKKIDIFLLEHYHEDWKHLLPYKASNSYIDNQESVQNLDPNVTNVEEDIDKTWDETKGDWYDYHNNFVKE